VLDVVINKHLKDHTWQLYNDWVLKGKYAFTPGGKLKKPSVTMRGNESWLSGGGYPVSQLLD
jgi:hypothetical protein